MLASRLSVAQILDGYEDVLYSMVVHADSIQPGHLGSFAFFYKMATPEVWVLMLTVFLVTMTFYALYHHCTQNPNRSLFQQMFTLFATAIGQGTTTLKVRQFQHAARTFLFVFQDEIKVNLRYVRPWLITMYVIWFLWSVFISGLLYSVMPSLFMFEQPGILPFNTVESLLRTNYTVYGSVLVKQSLSVECTVNNCFVFTVHYIILV